MWEIPMESYSSFIHSQSNAENDDKFSIAIPELEQIEGHDETAESFNEVVVMRYTKDYEPQFIEITNPAHRIIVEKVSDKS
jgi:hypothetical protein